MPNTCYKQCPILMLSGAPTKCNGNDCAWWLDDDCCIRKYVATYIKEKGKAVNLMSQIQQVLHSYPMPCQETVEDKDDLIGDPIMCETCFFPIDKCTCNVTNK